jgi:hypothetical protein
MCSTIYKIGLLQFCNGFLVDYSQNHHVLHFVKWVFITKEMKSPKWFFFSPRYTYMHNMGSLEQNMPWLCSWPSSFGLKAMELVHGSLFMRRVFGNYRIACLLFFVAKRSHIISIFYFFYLRSFKLWSTWRAWPSLEIGAKSRRSVLYLW